MVHRLKYSDLRALAPVMAGLRNDYLAEQEIQGDFISYVPLHPKR